MGQKVNPHAFRLGNLYTWDSLWYAPTKGYSDYVLEDVKIRKFLSEKLKSAGLVKIEIERSVNALKLRFHVSRPGVVIGRGGGNLETLKNDLAKLLKINLTDKRAMKIQIDEIVEVKKPDIEAKLIAERIAEQLVKRLPQRRAVSQAMERAMSSGAKGIKIVLSGRINGAEIGRREKYALGTVPTQTLRCDISYAHVPAKTRSGYVGIKVWVNKGERVIA
ncbi:30S ribosomal protein S3 [Candidatus Cerribacteria bacterium 'Amazon FNV 2010 28 9']|uniref:Small ribosomal subunit protein uS3 n=1 Tax=Candidatus Cerribacteria bacterium 'Amazon FNV 2010 28 9' TaxID=2081795 RepID=A0A317JPF4_9BACT|nr:MAG: 30S ribosomal protein S3 [Candidatus Cerribacteria bacterium 'Amazon FNV 2010 28 9']